jgi:hypothetical protein
MLAKVVLAWTAMAWVAYGISRIALAYLEQFGFPRLDAVALSFLAGLSMFVGLAMSTYDTMRERNR